MEIANAKLTRTLRVTGRRDDGYHLLESEMVSLDLADELTIGPGDSLEVVDEIAWVSARRGERSLAVPADDSNLVRRALRVVGRAGAVRLVKRIPPGAGLGGGSSDAGAVLRWAGEVSPDVAAGIGADVPFCVSGGRAMVRGVGEVLSPLGFEDLFFVVVTPDVVVSTAEVYRMWDELGGPVVDGDAGNDLEVPALRVEPRLSWWRDLVGGAAGVEPRLAGSGSSWFVECGSAVEANSLEARMADAVLAAGERALVRACRSVAPVPAASTARPRA